MSVLGKLFGPPSRDRFAAQVMHALRAAGDRRGVEYDAENFRLLFSSDGAGGGTSHLTNLWRSSRTVTHC